MNTLRKITKSPWFKMAVVATCYLLWVIWLGNYWWLLGLLVIFDLYITKKVKWAFWKKTYKEGEKRNQALDWLDALIFALIAATFAKYFFFEAYMIPTGSMENTLMTGDYLFVDKLKYGPKRPQYPLTVPLTHNVIMGRESYSTAIEKPYRRMAGFSHVKRNDVVVFNFPHGDTVLKAAPSEDYHTLVRLYGREYTLQHYGPVVARPAGKEDNYVKRCVAVAGDTLQVVDAQVYVNGQPQIPIKGLKTTYTVRTQGQTLNPTLLDKVGVPLQEALFDPKLPGYPSLPLTQEGVATLSQLAGVQEIVPNIDTYPANYPDSPLMLFPFVDAPQYAWTRDNYGPLWVPAKGSTVALTPQNIDLYRRIITVYEHHALQELPNGTFLVDGREATHYTFAQDYFFMMGDNRHNSLDSRYWGFVPEDRIVGTPSLVWFSTNKYKSFPNNIRWQRLFKVRFK